MTASAGRQEDGGEPAMSERGNALAPLAAPRRQARLARRSAFFATCTDCLSGREDAMGRKFIDCRTFPSEMNCSLALSADTEAELLEAAVQHAVAVHGHQDTPELREQLKGAFKDGTPSEEPPARAA
jgi:predicted small metal-binding protein